MASCVLARLPSPDMPLPPLDFPTAPTLGAIYTANGKSWRWDGTSWLSTGSGSAGVPVLTTLHETVFAGQPVGNIPAGSVTINGVTWGVGISAGGSFAIVPTGLQMIAPSGSGQENGFNAASLWGPTIGQERWVRGRNAIWARAAAWNRGTATGGFWYLPGIFAGGYPSYGLYTRRVINGTAWNINGGMWYAGESGNPLYLSGTNPTADVMMLYFRSPWEVEHWYGTYTTDWPTFAQMTCGGLTRISSPFYTAGGLLGATAASVTVMVGGGGQTGTNSASLIVDRFRITTWDS